MTVPRTNASHDQNHVTTIMGVSSTDGTTPIPVEVDELTGRILVNSINPSYTIKFASVAVSAPGNNTLVAAVSAKKLKLLSCVLVAEGTVSVKWRSNSTDLSGPMALVVNSGFVYPASSPGMGHYLETVAGEALILNLSTGVNVEGHLTYFEE